MKGKTKTITRKNGHKLVYVRNTDSGITRKRIGSRFDYFIGNKRIENEKEIERIKKLVIPPAWRNVWICSNPYGHLQATGLDARNRKQYRYHNEWTKRRNVKKFDKLLEFGKALPLLRKQVGRDIASKSLTKKRVIAAAIGLMERTYLRIGNSVYEKENGSYGITTLKDRHVQIRGGDLKISFKGKKGIDQNVTLHNKRLARIIKQCRDIPGKELFQFYDENEKHQSIDSGMVNTYIKEATNGDFTAKDFRTWAGTIHFIHALRRIGFNDMKLVSKNVNEALDDVSRALGNTRAVCRNYYVHPLVITMYQDQSLEAFLGKYSEKPVNGNFSCEEEVLMCILENRSIPRVA